MVVGRGERDACAKCLMSLSECSWLLLMLYFNQAKTPSETPSKRSVTGTPVKLLNVSTSNVTPKVGLHVRLSVSLRARLSFASFQPMPHHVTCSLACLSRVHGAP
jgi:hypothetical protein